MDINIMEIINQYAVIPVAVVCFLVGYMLKNVWADFNNKYIPLVLLPVGLVGVFWLNGWAITPENVLAGFCSAALAVYAHSTGKHVSELKPPDADKEAAGGGLNE